MTRYYTQGAYTYKGDGPLCARAYLGVNQRNGGLPGILRPRRYFCSSRGTLAQSSSPELAKLTDTAFAVFVPFFAPKPSTSITSPSFTRPRPQPRRSRSLMPTSSTAQLSTLPLA